VRHGERLEMLRRFLRAVRCSPYFRVRAPEAVLHYYGCKTQIEQESPMRRLLLLPAILLVMSATPAAQAPDPQDKMPLGSRPAPDTVSPSATVPFLTNASQDARTELALAKLAQQK